LIIFTHHIEMKEALLMLSRVLGHQPLASFVPLPTQSFSATAPPAEAPHQ
jgi:hypothetical protein